MKKIFSTWLQAICSPCFRRLHTFYVRFRAGTRQIPAASGDLPHPHDWPLFARMALMADNNLQRGAADMLPSLPRQRGNLPIHHISADNFTVASLQAELNALPESGGQIYLPPGRLLFEKPLHLPSHLHLIGSPGTELVFRTQEFALVIQGQHEALAQGIHLENLHIRHEGEHCFSAAVFISEAFDLHLHNVHIHAPLAVGFLLSDHVYRVRMTQCSVYHAGLAGFMLVRDVTDCLLQECSAEHCMQSGIFLTDLKCPSDVAPMDFDAQINHTLNVIGNFAPFAPEDPTPQRNTLLDCTFSRNRKMGITTDGTGNLRVLNCIIAENDCEGITLDNGAWQCEVLNCHISGNGWRGLQHEVELTEDFVEKMGLMADGGSKAKLPGISLDNAAYCHIKNNLIEKNWGDGVKFVRATYACTVASNLICHNNRGGNDTFHFFGILIGIAERQHPEQSDFASCHNRIIDNDIIGTHHAGIHLLPHTFGNLLRANRIIDAIYMAVEDHAGKDNCAEHNGENLFNLNSK